MDIATSAGIIAGGVVLVTLILMGGDLRMFVDAHAAIVIFGGAFAATLIRFPFSSIFHGLPLGAKFAFTMRRSVNANLAPSGRPWKIDDRGKRMSVAAKEPPKITMAACVSANIRTSPPIMMSEPSTIAPATRPRLVAISMDDHLNAYANPCTPSAGAASPQASPVPLKGGLPKIHR